VTASGVEAISEEQKKQIQEFTGANLGGVFKKEEGVSPNSSSTREETCSRGSCDGLQEVNGGGGKRFDKGAVIATCKQGKRTLSLSPTSLKGSVAWRARGRGEG
jgi:hypothetical protein